MVQVNSYTLPSVTSALNGFNGVAPLKLANAAAIEAIRFFCADIGTSVQLRPYVSDGDTYPGTAIADAVTMSADLTWYEVAISSPYFLQGGETLHCQIVAAVGTNTLLTVQYVIRERG